MIKTCSLGSVVDVSAGQPAPKSNEFGNEGLPFIRAGSLENLLNGGSLADCEKLPPSTAARKRFRVYPKDTIVFAKSGMSATLGRVYRLPEPAHVVSHLAALVPTGKYDPAFLTYWLRKNPPSHLIKDPAYPSIRVGDIAEVEIPAVPLAEQERISGILDKADRIRRKREQSLSLADEVVRSSFLERFGHPLDPNSHLVRSDLGEHCNFFAGGSLPKGEAFAGQEDGLLLIKVSDLNASGNEVTIGTAKLWTPSRSTAKGGVIAPRGSVVFPKRGGAIATNKKRVLERDCVLDPNLMAVAPKPNSVVSNNYVRTWFELIDLASISSGSSVPQLNKKDLAPLAFGVPEREAVHWFDGVFERTDRMKRHLSAALAEADALFASVSQRAFRGEL
jgi:type I restriction enzyme S subunit